MAIVKEYIRDAAKPVQRSMPRDEAIRTAEGISAETGRLVKVYDGETLILCHWNGKPHKCFVNGYGDAPEKAKKAFKRSNDFPDA